ncbi:hypothetical protein FQA39_LY01316 [Lamprigera yunnana]|nr:hypothetical protein FQA39_LY01316 [Lamprigera yunnana]
MFPIMEFYTKGINVEEPLKKSRIPIPGLPEEFLWMQVRGGSKMKDLLNVALTEFENTKHMVWTGFGPSVAKAISCAEIVKRQYKNNLHQITKICYRTVQEFWDPKVPDLEQIVVERKLPMVHILLSLTELDPNELGYQGPSLLTKNVECEGPIGETTRTSTNQLGTLRMNSKQQQKGRKKKNKRQDTTTDPSKGNLKRD